MSLTPNVYLIVALLTFVCVVLLLESLFLMWRSQHGADAQRLRSRLQDLAAENDPQRSRLLKEQMAGGPAVLESLTRRLPQAQKLQRMMDQSGLAWSIGKLATLVVLASAVGVAASIVLHLPPLVELGLAAAVGIAPIGYVGRKRQQRMRRLEQQLPDALDLLCRGLRAGHALSATLKMAGDELQEPIRSEFRSVHEEVNFGVSLQEAMSNLADRVPTTDMRYFVVAVLIQRESGGNLTEILGNLSHLVRERLKLVGRVRVLSAEGRMSAWILVLMPFVLGGVMTILDPKFMTPLWTDPMGISMIKAMLGMMLLGVLVVRKIVRIRV
jgi:tight adherence protein B